MALCQFAKSYGFRLKAETFKRLKARSAREAISDWTRFELPGSLSLGPGSDACSEDVLAGPLNFASLSAETVEVRAHSPRPTRLAGRGAAPKERKARQFECFKPRP